MLLKYGRPVAKCDPWIQRATQGPTVDGPFGDQWILYSPQMHWYRIHGLAQDCSISIANALEILQSCTKPSTDHPELRQTTQQSLMVGLLGDPGFCFFRSTDQRKHLSSTLLALCGRRSTGHSVTQKAYTVEPLYSMIGGVHEMRSCYRRIVVK